MVLNVGKYIDHARSSLDRLFREKTHHHIKYLFYPDSSSSDLIVVFSSCTRKGIPARYNYVRTLKASRLNRLYILDNEGDDHRGTYYLGTYPHYETEKRTIELITQIVSQHKIKRLFMAGSSKGGWAALNFAASIPISLEALIIGAPQYYLGNYLNASAYQVTMAAIQGDCPDKEVVKNELNHHLSNKMSQIKSKKIYLHYSVKDRTYVNHVQYMMDGLKEVSDLRLDIQDYVDHQNISYYFPKYLKAVLSQYLEKKG